MEIADIRRHYRVCGAARRSCGNLPRTAHLLEVCRLLVKGFDEGFGRLLFSLDEAARQTAVFTSKLFDRALLLAQLQ